MEYNGVTITSEKIAAYLSRVGESVAETMVIGRLTREESDKERERCPWLYAS